MDAKRPWKRCDGETERSYRLFLLYLGMGVKRSLRKVADSDDAPCLRVIERKSRRWNWRDRAEAFDLDEVRRIERAMLGRVRRQRTDSMRARSKFCTTSTQIAMKAVKAVEEVAGTYDLKTMEGIRQLNAVIDVIKKAHDSIGLSYLDFCDQERELERSVQKFRPGETDITSNPEDFVDEVRNRTETRLEPIGDAGHGI